MEASVRIMCEIFLTVGALAAQTFRPPSAAAESPSAPKCNFTQLQQLLSSSKCDLHGETQNTSLSCRHSTDPNVTTAIQLYNTSSMTGRLWFRNGTVPNCSSIGPPAPFSCVVCLYQFVHVVCSNLRTEDGMVELETDQTINTIKSDCPRTLGVGPVVQLMAQTSSALSCRATRLSDESGMKWEKQTIIWEETNFTVTCTCLVDEDHRANSTSQGSAMEAGPDKWTVAGSVSGGAAAAVIIAGFLIRFCKNRKSTPSAQTVSYSPAQQAIEIE